MLSSENNDHKIKAPKIIKLQNKVTILGRGSPLKPVDFIISVFRKDKEVISRQHALIEKLDDGNYVLKSMGAINGLFVNNISISEHILNHGDKIQLGGVAHIQVGTALENSEACVKYKFVQHSNKKISREVERLLTSTSLYRDSQLSDSEEEFPHATPFNSIKNKKRKKIDGNF